MMPETIASAAHPTDDAAFSALVHCLRIERRQIALASAALSATRPPSGARQRPRLLLSLSK